MPGLKVIRYTPNVLAFSSWALAVYNWNDTSAFSLAENKLVFWARSTTMGYIRTNLAQNKVWIPSVLKLGHSVSWKSTDDSKALFQDNLGQLLLSHWAKRGFSISWSGQILQQYYTTLYLFILLFSFSVYSALSLIHVNHSCCCCYCCC